MVEQDQVDPTSQFPELSGESINAAEVMHVVASICQKSLRIAINGAVDPYNTLNSEISRQSHMLAEAHQRNRDKKPEARGQNGCLSVWKVVVDILGCIVLFDSAMMWSTARKLTCLLVWFTSICNVVCCIGLFCARFRGSDFGLWDYVGIYGVLMTCVGVIVVLSRRDEHLSPPVVTTMVAVVATTVMMILVLSTGVDDERVSSFAKFESHDDEKNLTTAQNETNETTVQNETNETADRNETQCVLEAGQYWTQRQSIVKMSTEMSIAICTLLITFYLIVVELLRGIVRSCMPEADNKR